MKSAGGIMKQVLWIVAIVAGLMAGNAPAVDRYWQSTGNGDFSTGANWSGGTAPGTNDTANFTNNATCTVTFSSSVTNTFGVFSNSSGAVTFSPGANTWRLTGGGDSVAFKGAGGTVNLNGGTLSIGDKFGLGSIAGANNNKFQIYGGAVVDLNSVSGYGDAYLGKSGYGNTMIISNGASLLANRYIALGYNTGSSNTTVIVTGNGSAIRATSTFAVGLRSDNNLLRIESGGWVSNAVNAFVGGGYAAGDIGGGTGNFNRVVVSGGSWTNKTNLTIGQNGAGNRVTVTDGGLVYAGGIIYAGGGGNVDAGAISYSNVLEVVGGTVSIAGNGLYIGSKTYASNNTVIVNGRNSLITVNLNDAIIGLSGSGNSLVITNGGQMLVKRALWTGSANLAVNNRILVSGTNSLLGVEANLGIGVINSGNELRIENGGVVTNGAGTSHAYIGGCPGSVFTSVPASAGDSNRVTVTSGGAWTNNGHLYVGYNGQGNSLTVSSNGIVSLPNSYLNVGYAGASNSLNVLDGGKVLARHVYIGNTTTASNSAVVVSGAGSVLQTTLYDLNVGNSGGPFSSLVVSNGGQVLVYRTTYIGSATSGNNSILVGPGGLLEMGVGNYGDALIIGSAAGNTISNSGGVFQFKASAFNNINNGGNSANISITDGTVSFCGITDADVGVSAPGGKLNNTVMTWSGANTFMLNNATNKSSGQAYTFQPGNPTNFARLALLNGSLYRGGTATFGSGGVLMVTNGAAAITNVVLQAGATLAVHLKATNDYSQLTALGTVDVTGSTLAVSLGAAPDRDGFEYVIIRKNTAGGVTGTFANSTVIPTFGGREYPLRVNYAGGDGNDVSLVYRAPGTVFTIR